MLSVQSIRSTGFKRHLKTLYSEFVKKCQELFVANVKSYKMQESIIKRKQSECTGLEQTGDILDRNMNKR